MATKKVTVTVDETQLARIRDERAVVVLAVRAAQRVVTSGPDHLRRLDPSVELIVA